MNLDIRIPMGLLFSLLGIILTVYGLVSGPEVYRRSLGVNINLIWGVVLLLFGISMGVLAYARRPRREPASPPK